MRLAGRIARRRPRRPGPPRWRTTGGAAAGHGRGHRGYRVSFPSSSRPGSMHLRDSAGGFGPPRAGARWRRRRDRQRLRSRSRSWCRRHCAGVRRAPRRPGPLGGRTLSGRGEDVEHLVDLLGVHPPDDVSHRLLPRWRRRTTKEPAAWRRWRTRSHRRRVLPVTTGPPRSTTPPFAAHPPRSPRPGGATTTPPAWPVDAAGRRPTPGPDAVANRGCDEPDRT